MLQAAQHDVLTVTRGDLLRIALLGLGGLRSSRCSSGPCWPLRSTRKVRAWRDCPVPLLNGVISMLAALTIGISMRIVGILLIAALMVVPVIAAQRIAWSLRSTMGLAVAIGLGSVLTGLTVSCYANLPPGGTIVLIATAAFLVAAAAESLTGRL